MAEYTKFINEIKSRITKAQNKAVLSINAELITLYFDIGKMIDAKQSIDGWGASVILRLSKEIQNGFSKFKGFSERNIGYMLRFYREYKDCDFLQLPVAKIEISNIANSKVVDSEKFNLFIPQIPWTHNIILIQKIKDIKIRQRLLY